MKRPNAILIIAAVLLSVPGCSVISQTMMNEALTDVSFPQLLADASRYQGQTVILGGHVIEVRNKPRQTVIVVLQTPLGSGQEPLPRDRSQGRFLLQQEGFLDPEVYAKGRTMTVAGRLLGQTRENIDEEPYDYLVLEAREIYLWERAEDLYRYQPYYPPAYYDPWYYPHRRFGYYPYYWW